MRSDGLRFLPIGHPAFAEIVTSAHDLLEHEGPESLSMRRLASEVGMRAPSLYKHFSSKAAVELALVEDALLEIGEVSHRAIHEPGADGPLVSLLTTYRRPRSRPPQPLPPGHPREPGEGTPGAGPRGVGGQPLVCRHRRRVLGQALWSYAHGMVTLELDQRYPPGSDLDRTWRVGAEAFEHTASQVHQGP